MYLVASPTQKQKRSRWGQNIKLWVVLITFESRTGVHSFFATLFLRLSHTREWSDNFSKSVSIYVGTTETTWVYTSQLLIKKDDQAKTMAKRAPQQKLDFAETVEVPSSLRYLICTKRLYKANYSASLNNKSFGGVSTYHSTFSISATASILSINALGTFFCVNAAFALLSVNSFCAWFSVNSAFAIFRYVLQLDICWQWIPWNWLLI